LRALLLAANEALASISDGFSVEGKITNLVKKSPANAAKFIKMYLRGTWLSPAIDLLKTFVINRQTAKIYEPSPWLSGNTYNTDKIITTTNEI
jgi:hypothetical protein